MHVLLVDDDPGIRSLMSLVLEGKGFAVRSALDGLEALAVIERHCPDALVVDLDMPRMNGFELVRACRDGDGTRHPPIIAISAVYRGGQVVGLDVQAFLPKPFDMETLVAALATVL